LFLLSASSLGIDNIDLNYFKKTLEGISKLFNSLLAPIEQLEKKATLEQWNLDNCSFAHGLSFKSFENEVHAVRNAFLEHFDSFPSSTVLKDNKLTIEVSKSLNRLYICSARKGSITDTSWSAVTYGAKNKVLKDMFTDAAIEQSFEKYDAALGELQGAVNRLLTAVAAKLDKYTRFLMVSSTLVDHFKALFAHVNARGGRWAAAVIDTEATALSFKALQPYWMADGVAQDCNVQGQIILSGANASGKSTFIRSVISAALLGTCGLLAPCSSAVLPVLRSFYLRISARDDPKRAKSSFQIEIEDIALLDREADRYSVLGIDEAFRTTQPAVAADLSMKTLAMLAKRKTTTIFATHLIKQLHGRLPDADFYHIEERKLTAGPSFDSDAYAVALRSGVSPAFLGMEKEEKKTLALDDVLALVETEISKHTIVTRIEVPCGSAPPFIRSSVLYVLHTPSGFYYVGESDCFATRVEQHRLKDDRKLADAFVYPMANKSLAKKVESAVGAALFAAHVPMLSSSDNSHSSFGIY
jgi:hypothetical protein